MLTKTQISSLLGSFYFLCFKDNTMKCSAIFILEVVFDGLGQVQFGNFALFYAFFANRLTDNSATQVHKWQRFSWKKMGKNYVKMKSSQKIHENKDTYDQDRRGISWLFHNAPKRRIPLGKAFCLWGHGRLDRDICHWPRSRGHLHPYQA